MSNFKASVPAAPDQPSEKSSFIFDCRMLPNPQLETRWIDGSNGRWLANVQKNGEGAPRRVSRASCQRRILSRLWLETSHSLAGAASNRLLDGQNLVKTKLACCVFDIEPMVRSTRGPKNPNRTPPRSMSTTATATCRFLNQFHRHTNQPTAPNQDYPPTYQRCRRRTSLSGPSV